MQTQEVQNGVFLLSSVASSRCAPNWQTRIWKLKFKSNKLVDLRNLYMNMVVFGLELFNFWSWFRIWTWKHRFPKFLKIFVFLSLTHTVHLHACEMEREQRRRFFIIFGLKKLPEYKMRSNKRQGHKSGDYLPHFLSKLKFSCDPYRRKKSKTVFYHFLRSLAADALRTGKLVFES